jgi:hypothetical protein
LLRAETRLDSTLNWPGGIKEREEKFGRCIIPEIKQVKIQMIVGEKLNVVCRGEAFLTWIVKGSRPAPTGVGRPEALGLLCEERKVNGIELRLMLFRELYMIPQRC